MKQTIEQRREHHQNREDRQRKVYEVLQQRIKGASLRYPHGRAHNIEAVKRDAARLAEKLGITDSAHSTSSR